MWVKRLLCYIGTENPFGLALLNDIDIVQGNHLLGFCSEGNALCSGIASLQGLRDCIRDFIWRCYILWDNTSSGN